MNYFGVQRSTSVISIDQTFGEIVTVKANIDIYDKSKFYNLNYGYTLLRNQHGSIVLVAGLNVINLNYSIELNGELSKDDVSVSREYLLQADVYAPLPLLGLNYNFNYSKRFGILTKVWMLDCISHFKDLIMALTKLQERVQSAGLSVSSDVQIDTILIK